jgi:site-specific DNA-methyltransferase (adenine-specific)
MMIIEQMLKNAQTPLLHIADVSGSALFQGDCLDIMPLIPDKSVQLILADLPYGTTACKWDSIIDLDLLWKQYKRIMTDNGAIVLTASQPFTTKLISSNYEMFRYEWVWEKTLFSNFALVKKQPAKLHENILVFYKKQPIYNPQMQEGKPYTDKPRKRTMGVINDAIGTKKAIDNKGERYPSSVQKFSNGNNKTEHPTQKPLELMKYLIYTYSNENDMVLDNTMGSGTCPLASAILNRRFIGIEKDDDYFKIAVNRLKEFGYLR